MTIAAIDFETANYFGTSICAAGLAVFENGELTESPYLTSRRKKRHHLAGFEEVRKMWGDEAAAAPRQHIITYLELEGWRESDPFPKDENRCERMGLF